jgi:hypothetical protein
MSSSEDQAPKGEYDTKVPPSFDHKDQGFPPKLHHRPNLYGVQQQCNDTSRKLNDGRSHRHRWPATEPRQGLSPKLLAHPQPNLHRRQQVNQQPSPSNMPEDEEHHQLPTTDA